MAESIAHGRARINIIESGAEEKAVVIFRPEREFCAHARKLHLEHALQSWGIEEVHLHINSVRRIRGHNYCIVVLTISLEETPIESVKDLIDEAKEKMGMRFSVHPQKQTFAA